MLLHTKNARLIDCFSSDCCFFYYYLFPLMVDVSFQRDGVENGVLGVRHLLDVLLKRLKVSFKDEDLSVRCLLSLKRFQDFYSLHLSLLNLFYFSLCSYFLTCFNVLFLNVFLLELCYTYKLALHSNICGAHCAWKGRRTLQRKHQTLQKCFFLWCKYSQPNVCCCL